ncbi:hypothetical protein AAFF_G00129370 [Aldrovandia affinis]|uniref:LBH domain-containing protein n=1 Tax=Aldrovandia affinis TaxID=143900 RepID=A0AAD7WWW4_9TELE|nr:hypothetical protein AAFF_G00129370 [Aldrovandia affinis]
MITLEKKCPSAGPAEGEFGGSCALPPVFLQPITPMTTETSKDASFAIGSTMNVIVPKDSAVKESPLQEIVDHLAFQIFPDPAEVAVGGDLKERLPSIVVEPTELSGVESGELRWHPEDVAFLEDDEDPFQELCPGPTILADWDGEEEEGAGDQKGVQRRQSLPPTATQQTSSRLTPPPVIHSTEERPLCLRS